MSDARMVLADGPGALLLIGHLPRDTAPPSEYIYTTWWYGRFVEFLYRYSGAGCLVDGRATEVNYVFCGTAQHDPRIALVEE